MRFQAFIFVILIGSLMAGNALGQNDTSCYDIIHQGDALREGKSYQTAYDKYRSFIDTCFYLSNSWEFFSEVGAMNLPQPGGCGPA